MARVGLRAPLVAGLLIAGLGSLTAAVADGSRLLGSLREAGIASAVVNSSRQASGVLGVALPGALVAGGSSDSFVADLRLAGIVCAGVFHSLLYV